MSGRFEIRRWEVFPRNQSAGPIDQLHKGMTPPEEFILLRSSEGQAQAQRKTLARIDLHPLLIAVFQIHLDRGNLR